jgi:uncharacterized membrane protein YkvA (DUF1232 family)
MVIMTEGIHANTAEIDAVLSESRALVPAILEANERVVKRRFWAKAIRLVGKVPFVDDLMAGYFCAMDSATPFKVRATLFAALAYFVMPADLVPDVLLHFGFTDDAAVLTTALTIVGGHIRPAHRARAARALHKETGQPA